MGTRELQPRRTGATGPLMVFATLALLAGAAAPPPALARPIAAAGAKGRVNLPYQPPFVDAAGNRWYIYANGWLQQQGNMPLFSQGAVLTINGAQPAMQVNQARLDDNGELVFDNMQGTNCTVTRRMMFAKEGYVRIIDVFKNTQPQEQALQVNLSTNINYGVSAVQLLEDPKKKGESLACLVQDGQNRHVLEMYAGKRAKVGAQVTAAPNNSAINASLSLTVGGGKEVAIMHVHWAAPSADAGVAFVTNLKEKKFLADVPREVRKLLVNFNPGQGLLGDSDLELLRGDAFDVVELRGGDQYKGTLADGAYKLRTPYGEVEVSADRVAGLFNVGDAKPRQLVVTTDGEVYGGQLERETIPLQLSSGQKLQLPLAQMTRVGYRTRAGEPEDVNFDKVDRPTVFLRTGERLTVRLPAGEIPVLTRYGALRLKPESISALVLQNEEMPVHQIQLVDGSKFAGLVAVDAFEMELSPPPGAPGKAAPTPGALIPGALIPGAATRSAGGEPAGQAVKFPASAVARIQFTARFDEADDATPTLKLANDDLMVGAITGALKLETAFDTLSLDGSQIKGLTRPKAAGPDVTARLFDDTTLSGLLQSEVLECKLRSGVEVRVPVALLAEYAQPYPEPSGAQLERLQQIVAMLNADDWRQRDAAGAQLERMGPSVVGVLRGLRDRQPPEGQRRVDQIIKALRAAGKDNKGGSPATGAPAAPDPGVEGR